MSLGSVDLINPKTMTVPVWIKAAIYYQMVAHSEYGLVVLYRLAWGLGIYRHYDSFGDSHHTVYNNRRGLNE